MANLWKKIKFKWFYNHEDFLYKSFFPELNNLKVLWVGVSPKCVDYWNCIKDVVTIDINPLLKKYGSKNHIIGNFLELKPDIKYDIITLFGVFGYGINDVLEAEDCLIQCWHLLKKGGRVVLNQSLMEQHNQIKVRELFSYSLFQPLCYDFKISSPTKIGGALYEVLLKKENSNFKWKLRINNCKGNKGITDDKITKLNPPISDGN